MIKNFYYKINKTTHRKEFEKDGSEKKLILLLTLTQPLLVHFFLVLFKRMVFTVFFFVFNLFLAALGLCCCTRAFSSCGKRGLLFVEVRRLLIAVASLVVEHGL